LDEWKAEIDKMKAKADKVDADAQLEYYKQVEDLHLKYEATQEKLEELKEAGEDAWEDLKAGLVALDDFINPKTGRKVFGCSHIFDHTAKANQFKYPWAQNVVWWDC